MNKKASSPPGKRFRWRYAVAAVLGLPVLAGAVVYVERRPIAAYVARTYLLRYGIDGSIEFTNLEGERITARVRMGPSISDFSADLLDVILVRDTAFSMPRVRSVRLVQPVLRAAYDGTRLQFGSLQSLIDEALSKPSEEPGPFVEIEKGMLFLSTPDGAVQILADAVFDKSRLDHFTAKLSPAKLQGKVYSANIQQATISARLVGESLAGSIDLALNAAKLTSPVAMELGNVAASARFENVTWRQDGKGFHFTVAHGQANLQSEAILSDVFSAALTKTNVTFENLDGNYRTDQSQISASLDIASEAAELRSGVTHAGMLSNRLSSTDFNFTISGDQWSATGPYHFASEVMDLRHDLDSASVSARMLRSDFTGSGTLSNTAIESSYRGTVSADEVASGTNSSRALRTDISGTGKFSNAQFEGAFKSTLTANGVRSGNTNLRSLRTDITGTGTYIDAAFTGSLGGVIVADDVTNDKNTIRMLRADLTASGRGRPGSLDGRIKGTVTGENIALDQFSFPAFRVSLDGAGRNSSTGIDGSLEGAIETEGTVAPGFASDFVRALPGISADPALPDSLIKAMQTFAVRIPSFRIQKTAQETTLNIPEGVSLSGQSGAKVDITQQSDRPVWRLQSENMDGAIALTLTGGGLPDVKLSAPDYRLRSGANGFEVHATTQFDTRLNFAVLKALHLEGSGTLDSDNGRLQFALGRCANVDLGTFMGANGALVSAAKAQLCSDTTRPLLVSDEAGWKLAGAVNGASARLELPQSVLANGRGVVELSGGTNGQVIGKMSVSQSTLTDLQTAPRFLPINATGTTNMAGYDMQGQFDLTAHNARIASISFRHSLETSSGKADISTRALAFDPAILQPSDVSPMLSAIGSKVRGQVDFAGQVGWTPSAIESSGLLQLRNVDFQSRAGVVRHASGELKLNSLIPPVLAPSQTITMERIDWLVPVEQAKLTFTMSPTDIKLETVTANMVGGTISLDPQTFTFLPAPKTEGLLRFEHIDLNPIFAAAGLAERVSVGSRIRGTVPFAYGPEGLRFTFGRIFAESPGRLSIKRDIFTGGPAMDGTVAPPTNAVQDFAYQALENLAFEELDGVIDSIPGGRLGVLLHVKGHHDPMVTLETRIGVIDLVGGTAFNQPLPLPKGTPVDLTLDTSLNLDELLASYFASGGSDVAPAP